MKLRRNDTIRFFSIFILLAFLFNLFYYIQAVENEDKSAEEEQFTQRLGSYQGYINQFQEAHKGASDIFIPGASFNVEKDSGVRRVGSFNGEEDVILWDSETGWVEWNIEVPEAGLYNLDLKYYPLEARDRDIEMSIMLDGEIPFEGARKLLFSRIWSRAEDIKQDTRGNDQRPHQVEAPMWMEEAFRDKDGLYNGPYQFFFTAGIHTIRLYLMREALAIAGLHFHSDEDIPDYEQVKSVCSDKGYQMGSGFSRKIQAEDTSNTSHSTIYPMYDKTNAGTEPSDPSKIRLNTVGQWNWSFQGQWISWKFEVPSDGLYRIAIKARQNFISGMYSTRSLTIDGELPFKEMGNVKFPYKNNWYIKVLEDENKDPYLFYLTKGSHELKLEVVAGDMAETLRTVEEIVYDLNSINRRIIMITGASSDISESYGPDQYRDYRLEEKIPGLLDDFREIIDKLSRQKARYEQFTDGNGSAASIMDQISHQLSGFIKEPDTIPLRLENFKSNISSLGAWILDMRQQPLELDYLVVQSAEQKLPSANSNIFSQTWFGFSAFMSSFSEDYNSIGTIYDDESSLDVWVIACDPYITGVSVGRDQAQLIKNLVDEMFIPKSGTGVNLSLIDSPQTLIQATLAGKGPDAALFLPKETPVNLAMRGALYDLSKLEGYDKVINRFMKSAAIPFEYEGGHYAIPETQDFYMMFYRKDIFYELGLHAPDTWQDFYDMIPVIQKNNMQIGIQPESQQVFQTLLFQRGVSFYSEDRKSTDLDKPGALEAFREWTGFYSNYSFPLKFDFFNRFRTGEMPVGIMPYSTYNLLSVGAPELRNLWEMVPIPGTVQPDGSINRADSSNGTGSVILKGAKDPEAAFAFLEWWSSTEVQARYGNELESLMGPAARYNTANVEAFKRLAWSKAEAESLLEQWKSVWDIPQLPGNYYTSRNILFAFRKVVYDNENVREVLNNYNIEINKELLRKRAEFKLD